MDKAIAQRSVGNLVRRRLSRANVFERYGIDYCCRGKVPLEQACARAGVSLEEVCCAIDVSDSAPPEPDENDWSAKPLSLLIEHIVERHHVYLRQCLPQLQSMIERVVAAHAGRHPELQRVRIVFESLQSELTAHMMKEERVLFPIAIELEQAAATQALAPQFHCGSVNNPIAVMEQEHENAGDALRKLRRLTHDFQPPQDACDTYRALLAGLKELEADLHRHIHKENNILFPRAAELESAVAWAG